MLASVSQYIQTRTLMLGFSLVIHFFTCITTERYFAITSRTDRISASQSKWVIAIVTIYVMVLWFLIVFDDICIYGRKDCISKLWFLHGNNYRKFFSKNTTIAIASYEKDPTYGNTSKFPMIVITTWMTICNTLLNVTTLATIRFIRKSIRNATRTLGASSSRFETRRLKVVHALSTFFSLLWIPYGVLNGQQKNLDPVISKTMQMIMETICYASFFAIPLVVYVMDKRFALQIKSWFRRNRVAVVEPVQPVQRNPENRNNALQP